MSQNLRLLHDIHLTWPAFFVLEKNFTHFLGAQAAIWGTTASKCHPTALKPLVYLGAQFSLGGHIFHLGGTSDDLGGNGSEMSPWRRTCIVGLLAVVNLVSIVDLVGMVYVVGLVDMVSKHQKYSRQGRHSLAWDNKTLTLLCLLEQPVFYFVYIAFTISKQCLLNNRFRNWLLEVVPEAHYKQIDKFLSKQCHVAASKK